MQDIFTPQRNSNMFLNEVYFWTDTVKDWKNVFKQEKYKELIVQILKDLVDKKLIAVYAFVIMPNHIHLVWELLAMNGKEKPSASFNKATGNLIVKDLKANHPNVLKYFKVDEKFRAYRVWQNNSLAVLMDSKSKLIQKIDYIHLNPLQEKWNLAERPEDYKWSSATFYLSGKDEFNLLTHYKDRIG
jgi:putative transposase